MAKIKAPEEAGRVNALIGEHIKTRREALNITQEQMCEKLDISVDGYKKNENGYNGIPIYRLLKIMSILDCDFEYIIGDIPEPKKAVIDIHEMTGLSKETCETLLLYKDQVVPVIDWLFNNGFMDMILDMSELYENKDLFKLYPLPEDMYHQSEEAFQKSTGMFWKSHEIDEKDYLYDLFSAFGRVDLRLLKQWSLFDFQEPHYINKSEIVSFEEFKSIPFVEDLKLPAEKQSLVYDLAIHAYNSTFDYFALKHTLENRSLDYMVKFKSLMDRYIECVDRA